MLLNAKGGEGGQRIPVPLGWQAGAFELSNYPAPVNCLNKAFTDPVSLA